MIKLLKALVLLETVDIDLDEYPNSSKALNAAVTLLEEFKVELIGVTQNTKILRITCAEGSCSVHPWNPVDYQLLRFLSEDDVSKLEAGGQVEKHGRVFVLEEDEVV